MPRSYMPAFPDIRGQKYERTPISETQSSPLDTAGDVHGITGTVISSGTDGEIRLPVIRRYRYRLGWDLVSTEQAVDIEYAALYLCADGTGVCPFIEWEVTDESDYPIVESVGNPTFAFPLIQPDLDAGSIIFVHWWEVRSFTLVDFGGGAIDQGWPEPDGSSYVVTQDDTWLGNIPSMHVPDWAPDTIGGAYVQGRRIRIVTTEAGSYVREKTKQPDRWSVSVTLIEKETGIAPGYARA